MEVKLPLPLAHGPRLPAVFCAAPVRGPTCAGTLGNRATPAASVCVASLSLLLVSRSSHRRVAVSPCMGAPCSSTILIVHDGDAKSRGADRQPLTSNPTAAETRILRCKHMTRYAAQRSAHRWRPAADARIAKRRRRAAIRWSAWLDPRYSKPCAFRVSKRQIRALDAKRAGALPRVVHPALIGCVSPTAQ